MALSQESKSLCLKRKLVDDCLSKECKSRRVKVDNGPSADPSAKRCKCCCTRPNLASDCVNYLKSGVPSRIVFYKQGSWYNFPELIMNSLIEEFKGGKSSVVTVMDDEPVLVDFLSMTLVNLKTRKQRSVAWFDDTGKGFFPSLFFDEQADEMANVTSGNVEGNAQGIMLDKVVNSPPEVVKQVVLESSPPVPQNPSTADVLRKKITSVERGTEDFLFVQDLFLSGLGPFATPNNILHIHRYAPNDITAQCRLQAFERQMSCTKEDRGDSNVRYGWLGSTKTDIVRILIHGFGTTGKPTEKACLSAGVYLSPEDRAFTSVGLCDVDEKGVQYMLLCRVILGNMEAITPGSQDSFPSSEIYDSGVDDCSNPKCYVMWPSHLSTHIRLEYLVSFRLPSKVRHYLLGLKGLWFQPSPKEVPVDVSTLQPIMGGTGEAPTSPWISFKVLFAMIQDNISSVARELLFHHYEELKENEISREQMVKNMIVIVGEKLLLETLKKLHYCPSLWYKSSIEVISGDPVRTAAEDPARTTKGQISLDQKTRNCALTLRNLGDSHAPNALAGSSTALSNKGCDALAVGMVLQSYDSLTPSSVPETSTSAGAICRTSSNLEPKDPFAARMAPIVHDGLLKTASGKNACLGAEGHVIVAPGLSPKGSESLGPGLALGNSKSRGVKGSSSVRRRTPEGQEFLSLSIAPQSQSPVLHSVKDHGGVAAPVHAPGHVNSPPLSTVCCDSLALSIASKGHDPTTSSSNKEPKCHRAPTTHTVSESQHSQVPSAATKGHTAPTPITGEPKNQSAQFEKRNKSPGPILEPGSNIAQAADILIALSTPREKGN
ncbi:probable inactive poly [ADP-ribose] polymerase SRO1 isoform X3 [Brachypodium distachyon]|uniref:probable inactive poly [ADP-ribose] polymerase SRO1 isoform X3 n=1 Tax=Brachypodium distachyon TaxID=15368 RepID=UPI00071E642E|nr:probable inactive poly [ADP-ribose] polymerase SRO1 isoform X3 [Brachypodium distachyon]|eukprot:XP_014752937.1 probable inactive poly [ADP-ribose] polymerase SRO1 isoform X3 [Brachypodium distachyon]